MLPSWAVFKLVAYPAPPVYPLLSVVILLLNIARLRGSSPDKVAFIPAPTTS